MKKPNFSPVRLLILSLSGALLWWFLAPGEDSQIAAEVPPAIQIAKSVAPAAGQPLPSAIASTAPPGTAIAPSSLAVTPAPSQTPSDDPFKAFLAAHPNGEGNIPTPPLNAPTGVDPFQQAMERARQPVTTISPFSNVKTH